jgi:ribosomal protein L37AE/L43A
MISKKFCPLCKGEDVEMMAGGVTGSWMCKKCGYNGIMPEKEFIGGEGENESAEKD